METPEAKEVYRKRIIVEQPFGNVKYNMKYTEFQTRGTDKIDVEKDIINSACNLKLMWNKILKTTNKIKENIAEILKKHTNEKLTTNIS